MRFLISLVITLEILLAVIGYSYQPIISKWEIKHTPIDNRIAALTQFMDKHKFTKPYYVNEYIEAADKNGFGISVLPCIDLLESSGGWHYPKDTNNRWGYGSSTGMYRFESISKGISYISDKLANGKYYAGKSLEQKIKTYNSANPAYYSNFLKCTEAK